MLRALADKLEEEEEIKNQGKVGCLKEDMWCVRDLFNDFEITYQSFMGEDSVISRNDFDKIIPMFQKDVEDYLEKECWVIPEGTKFAQVPSTQLWNYDPEGTKGGKFLPTISDQSEEWAEKYLEENP